MVMQGPPEFWIRTPAMTCPALATIGPDDENELTRGPAEPLFGDATGVDGGAVVVVAPLPPTQQVFNSPTAGSPNTWFVQATPLLAVTVLNLSEVPYRTARVPEKEQVPPSVAHCDHATSATVGDSPDDSASVDVPPLPPQADRSSMIAAVMLE
jgi:hypothetical protein